jgi:hypothetical protein
MSLVSKSDTEGHYSTHLTRLEAIVHNARALNIGRTLEFPLIVAGLAGMADRFTTNAGLRPYRLPARAASSTSCPSHRRSGPAGSVGST